MVDRIIEAIFRFLGDLILKIGKEILAMLKFLVVEFFKLLPGFLQTVLTAVMPLLEPLLALGFTVVGFMLLWRIVFPKKK